MDKAPRDGTIIIVLHREFNAKDGKPAVQPAQWLCDPQGMNWGWKKPWHMGTTAHADAFMTVAEFVELASLKQEAKISPNQFDL